MRYLNNSLVPCALASLWLVLADGPTCQAQTSVPPKEAALEADAATVPADHPKDGGQVPPETPSTITLQSKAEQAAEERIRDGLEKKVDGHFANKPLGDVLNQLSQAAGIPIQIDTKALKDASITKDVAVQCDLPSVSLASGLALLLDPLDITWIAKNEVLLITTPEKASNELVTKVYPVLDLMSTRPSNFGQLINVITTSIAPTTWDEVGGAGSIAVFSASGALVVSQTGANHRQISELLTALRSTRDAQGMPRFVTEPSRDLQQPNPGQPKALGGPTTPATGDQPAADKAAPAAK